MSKVSGRDALKRIDTTLHSARRDLGHLEQELQTTSGALARNKLEQARAIDRMARIRLDAAGRGELAGQLEAAVAEAQAILESRERAIESVALRIASAREAVDAVEARREALHAEVDAAARVLGEREAAVQAQLDSDDAFASQLERTRKADAIAASAREKASLADDDRRRKGEPFEADELFMYLWRRGFGTSDYSAHALARLLDGWVARLCGYQDARPNYWMLLEIPKRLAEHADGAREAADAELDRLQDLEAEAAIAGQVPDARAELERLESEQDALDDELAAAEDALRDLQLEQARFVAGEDDYQRRALRAVSAAIERRDTQELMHLARATMTDEDDVIVDDLRGLRREFNELEAEQRENRDVFDRRLERIRELESVRRDFKHNRYDDVHSQFVKGATIERMIGEVLAGVIHGNTLWRTLMRYQRYVDTAGEWPDFGSGGIAGPRGRKRRRGGQRSPTWHWPGSSGGGFRMPRGGGSGGRGGFKTGGGF